jgi:hypothetical protein
MQAVDMRAVCSQELTSPITGMGMEPEDEVTRNILKKVKAHVGFGGELH